MHVRVWCVGGCARGSRACSASVPRELSDFLVQGNTSHGTAQHGMRSSTHCPHTCAASSPRRQMVLSQLNPLSSRSGLTPVGEEAPGQGGLQSRGVGLQSSSAVSGGKFIAAWAKAVAGSKGVPVQDKQRAAGRRSGARPGVPLHALLHAVLRARTLSLSLFPPLQSDASALTKLRTASRPHPWA